jgi:hypothetical protein
MSNQSLHVQSSATKYVLQIPSLLLAVLSPRNIYYKLQLGIQFAWQWISAIFGGVYLFFRSLLNPPPTRTD